MANAKPKTEVEEVEEEIQEEAVNPNIEISPDDEFVREPAILDFFQQFEDKTDFVVTVYKKKPQKAKDYCFKLESSIPDLDDIRRDWGGGTYMFYIHNFQKKLLKFVSVNIAEPMSGASVISPVTSKAEVISEMKEIFSMVQGFSPAQNGDSTNILLKFMEMSQQQMRDFSLNMNKQIEILAGSINKSSGGGFKEALENIILIKDNFMGESSDSGTGNGVLDALVPILSNVAGAIMNKSNVGNTPKPKDIPTEPIKPSIQDFLNVLPKDFIEAVTRENSEKMILHLHTKNSGSISADEAKLIIEEILKSKGL